LPLNKLKRHQKLAASVAFIGATSPDLKAVTACSCEISFPNDNERRAVTLRIAQNQLIAAAEMERFRDLLKAIVDNVLSREVDSVTGMLKMVCFLPWHFIPHL
jgi:hypothetical protein